jgi:hypothetical protein
VGGDKLVYDRGELSVDRIEQEISDFWIALNSSEEIQHELAEVGLDRSSLDGLDLNTAIQVTVDSSGADPASILLIISLAPTANRVLKDIWSSTLLPRIRRRWGDDAIGEDRTGSKV